MGFCDECLEECNIEKLTPCSECGKQYCYQCYYSGKHGKDYHYECYSKN